MAITTWGEATSATLPGSFSGAQVARLLDGGFLMVWTDLGAPAQGRAQVLNADGTKRGAEFAFATTVGQPTLTTLTDGRVAVLWDAYGGAEAVPQVRVFDRDGTLLGDSVSLEATRGAKLAALSDGRIAVVASGATMGPYPQPDWSQVLRIENGQLVKDGAAQVQPTGTNPLGFTSVGFDDRYALFYRYQDQDTFQDQIRMLIRNADGSQTAPAQVVFSVSSALSNPAAARLEDGRFVAVFFQGAGATGTLKARILNTDGTPAGAEFVVAAGERIGTSKVVALPDGGFAILHAHQGAEASIQVRCFSASGAAAGDPFTVTEPGIGLNDLSLLADGRLMLSWTSVANMSEATVRYQILDPRTQGIDLTGTAGNDQYFGSAFDDYIRGAGGSDEIIGAAGNDTLDGGEGSQNTLDGGAGNDVYFIHNASDVVRTDPSGLDTAHIYREDYTDEELALAILSLHGKGIENVIVENGTGGGNTPPTVPEIQGDVASVNENTTGETVIATVRSGDSQGDPFTFVLTVNPGNRFTVNSNGRIILQGPVDFEQDPDLLIETDGTGRKYFLIEVKAQETGPGGLSSGTTAIKVYINDVGEAQVPPDVNLTANSVNELAGKDTAVGTLIATDPNNAGAVFQYRLIDDAGGRFAIEGNRVVVANGFKLDFEQARTHNVMVEVRDGSGNVFSKVLTLNVLDINPETTAGSPFDDIFKGGAKNDRLGGGAGNDILWGGAGNDTLTGNGGRDIFVFNTKPHATRNKDKIKDFRVRDDTIWLDNAVFKKLGAKGSESKPALLKKGYFTIGDAAADANDYIVYDKSKGILYYDADGSGAGKAVIIATLPKNLKMTHKDFYVI
ncbi:M10 family metallopeptidase C-terminal domain-containing protein [Microvirga flavescens]|uniref:M10 family metallopeptidase C-terminal domain-containing protein n=1 Tax=Microvirga flavescens TaxID=2249811 RepID=UPI000DD5E648|nr:hypothetical protein [Microvirga flavescens]